MSIATTSHLGVQLRRSAMFLPTACEGKTFRFSGANSIPRLPLSINILSLRDFEISECADATAKSGMVDFALESSTERLISVAASPPDVRKRLRPSVPVGPGE